MMRFTAAPLLKPSFPPDVLVRDSTIPFAAASAEGAFERQLYAIEFLHHVAPLSEGIAGIESDVVGFDAPPLGLKVGPQLQIVGRAFFWRGLFASQFGRQVDLSGTHQAHAQAQIAAREAEVGVLTGALAAMMIGHEFGWPLPPD